MNNYDNKHALGEGISSIARKLMSRFKRVAFTGDYEDLENKPDLSTVLTTEIVTTANDEAIDALFESSEEGGE